MINIKKIIVIILLIAGIYMLVAHYAPIPFNHEQVGLGYNHMLHRIIGVVFLASAVLIFWKWKK